MMLWRGQARKPAFAADRSGDRADMVRHDLAERGIGDPRVLAAMQRVPRDAFVPDHLKAYAYDDGPLPIGHGQTISQPYIVALMVEAAEVDAASNVLEVGTGSGYAAAILAETARHVSTIERNRSLADAARARLAGLGYSNVDVHAADGSEGWPAAAPFDVIVAAAGAPGVPEPLKAQLARGGRLIIPVGPRGHQSLRRVRRADNGFVEQNLGAVAFVPLVGRHGWAG
jgi:protein-L-isoaspartate(D-aspartate) O-methyltransferase